MRHPKLIGALAGITVAGTAFGQTAPEVTGLDTEAPEQILFVGNSYLYYGDSVHNHVRRMAEAAYPDIDLDYKSATISGAYLAQHAIEPLLEPGMLGVDEPFDVVILQGHSTAMTQDDKIKGFNAAATAMHEAIGAAEAQTALYMTPAYTEANDDHDPGMFESIDRGYTQAGNRLGALVIPTGLAFEMAYEQRPDMALHKSFDGSHPTLSGTYLAAATTYAALYGKSAVGNPYTYFGAISADDAAFLQRIAEEAVASYYGREG